MISLSCPSPANLTRWDALDAIKYRDEGEAVSELLAANTLSERERSAIVAEAIRLVEDARTSSKKQGVVEGFLQEFSLGTREGLALMCLAEAVLRTPDTDTRDRLIAEKIGSANWQSHLGHSDSLFVNASTWGLVLTGKLIDVEPAARSDFGSWLRNLTSRIGEPVVRQAVSAAVRMMGNQFVLAHDITAALRRAKRERCWCSFDMLGEGARTAADAERYETIYAEAIEAVGRDRTPGLRPEDCRHRLSALYNRQAQTDLERRQRGLEAAGHSCVASIHGFPSHGGVRRSVVGG